MKTIWLLIIGILAAGSSTFSQCPEPGLKIQSPICDSAKNLQVTAISCSELKVQWSGNQNQKYIVKAAYADPSSDETIETKASEPSCNNDGNCLATIPVKEGTNVRWSVQAMCSDNNVIIYSYTIDGPEVNIPVCNTIVKSNLKLPDSASKNIRVYPNPSSGLLTVSYYGKVTGSMEFTVYDINGKRVFQQLNAASSKLNSSYNLNLHTLLSGNYLLKAKNGNEVSVVKFVLLRSK